MARKYNSRKKLPSIPEKWLRWRLGLVCVDSTNWIQAQEYHCTVSQCSAVSVGACTKQLRKAKYGSAPNMSESFPLFEEDDI